MSKPELNVVPFPMMEPHPEIGEMLGELTRLQESGAIDGIAVVVMLKDGGALTTFVKGGNLFALMGATSYMMRRLEAQAEEMVESSGFPA